MRGPCEHSLLLFDGNGDDLSRRELANAHFCGGFFVAVSTMWCAEQGPPVYIEEFLRQTEAGDKDDNNFDLVVIKMLMDDFPCR